MAGISEAQCAIQCAMCEEVEDVDWYCVNCEDFLCKRCNNMHKKTKKTREDMVIPRDLVELQIQMDKYVRSCSSPDDRGMCEEHNQTVSGLCQTCNARICFTCLWYRHYPLSKHRISLISAGEMEAEENLQKSIRFLEVLLKSKRSACQTRYKDANHSIELHKSMKAKLDSEIEARADALVKDIADAKCVMLQLVNTRYSEGLGHLERLKSRYHSLNVEWNELTAELEEKLKTSRTPDLRTFTKETTDKLKKFELPKKPENAFTFSLVPTGTVDDIFGVLETVASQNMSEKKSDGVSRTFHVEVLASAHTTQSTGIGSICPVSETAAWLVHSNGQNVTKVDRQGKELKTLKTSFHVHDIDVNGDQEMVLTTGSKVMSKDLTHEKSQFEVITDLTPYRARGVALMRNPDRTDILVCAQLRSEPGKVIRLSRKGEIITEIRDVTDEPVLRDPYRVSHNIINGDIVIACGKKVLIYSQDWALKGQWEGPNKQFNPHGVTYDNYGRILVTCHNNNSVYILDQKGEEEHILLDKSRLVNPWAIAVDVSGKMWVTCFQGVFHIIRYTSK